jgi:hypothetical protein
MTKSRKVNIPLTESEISFIRNNVKYITDREIAEQLSKITGKNISTNTCTRCRYLLELGKRAVIRKG